jgi:hypothetical protein
MDELLCKEIEFIWRQYYQEYFEFLKKKLVEAPILKFLNFSRRFHVHVDASNVIVALILAQQYDEKIYQPGTYASLNLNKA